MGTTLSTCPSITLQLNGSAIPLYNSTTYYDKLLWSAAWLYRVCCSSASSRSAVLHHPCMTFSYADRAASNPVTYCCSQVGT